jgi:DNA modification methylase
MSATRIVQGDCREVCDGMLPSSLDAIVTDPPYDLAQQERLGERTA